MTSPREMLDELTAIAQEMGLYGDSKPTPTATPSEPRLRVVFVAGPYRGETPWDVELNVRRAEEASLKIWQMGMVPSCPHTICRFFDKIVPDPVALPGTKELLRRTDAVLVVGDWTKSTGTQAEIAHAQSLNIPVFYTFEALIAWKNAR